jgi:CHAD domain-containing protein
MRKAFSEQSRIVEQAAGRLRVAYDVGQLHDLRVAMRRLRSLLKQHGKRRARRWRRIWGSFARVTGRARDWDVFLEAADALLEPSQQSAFRAASLSRVQAAHDAVRAMLQSAAWERHLDEWQAYAAAASRCHRHAGRNRRSRASISVHTLKPALVRANRALAGALALPDDSGWHPFRIAVKELRYQADRLADGTGRPPEPQAVIATCKEFQAQLGGWHDCVVQLQLLDELQPAAGANDPLLRELRDRIEALRRERLAGIREALARQYLLQPPKGVNG